METCSTPSGPNQKVKIKNVAFAKQLLAEPHKFGQVLGYKKLTPLHSEWFNKVWMAPKTNQKEQGMKCDGCGTELERFPEDKVTTRLYCYLCVKDKKIDTKGVMA